jgi:hypothetical protein
VYDLLRVLAVLNGKIDWFEILSCHLIGGPEENRNLIQDSRCPSRVALSIS